MYALHYIKYKTLTYKYILLYIYLLNFFKLIVSFIFSIIFRFHACYFRECEINILVKLLCMCMNCSFE